jgi:uncharacterized membrane protein YdcZ (DUF606 family)
MLEPTIAILGSYLVGLVLFAFMFGYFSLVEGIQKRSDSGSQYRKWVRRGGHLGLMAGFISSLFLWVTYFRVFHFTATN